MQQRNEWKRTTVPVCQPDEAANGNLKGILLTSAKWVFIAVFFVVLLLLLVGCRATKYVPVEVETVRVERESVTLHDTIVEVKREVQRDSVVTADTVSHLQNRYAESWARIEAGMLRHSLNVLPGSDSVDVKVKEVVKEVEIEKPVPVIVEKERSCTMMERVKLGSWWFVVGFAVITAFLLSRKGTDNEQE